MNLAVSRSQHRLGLTPEQANAAYAESHVAVTAGAGTGKTHMLSARYLHLLTQHQFSPLEIVAVTFTRKAATELRSRIRKTIMRELPDRLDIVVELEAAPITTIDALALRICEEHPEAAGVPADFQLLDELEGELHQQEYVVQSLAALPERFYQQIPYSLLESVVSTCLVDPKAAQQSLQCDSANWAEWVDREVQLAKSQLLNSGIWQLAKQQLTTTIGQAGDKLEFVRQEAISAIEAIEKDEEVRNHLATITSLKINVGSKKNWSDGGLEATKESIKALRSLVEKTLKDGLITLSLGEIDDQLAAILPILQEAFAWVWSHVQSAKNHDRQLSFSDVELGALKALEDASVREYYQKRWRVFLIDEFQDTNPNQGKLLEALTGNAIITIVGDIKQSIYGFRRADVTVFQDWQKRILQHHGESVDLGRSFRSHQELVTQINQIFEPILGELHQDLSADRKSLPELSAPIRIACVTLGEADKADKTKKQYIEAQHIAQEIRQILDAKTPVYDKSSNQFRPIQTRDIAILSRTWEPLEVYSAALEDVGIPTVQVGGGNLLDSREVKDEIALLRFLVEPNDDLALIASLRSPFFGVSDRLLFQLAASKDKKSWWRHLQQVNPPELARAIGILQQLLGDITREVPSVILQRANLLTGYSAIIANLPGVQRRLADWRGLIDLLHQQETMESDSATIVRRLKSWYAADVKVPRPVLAAGEAVSLMTIHASKGLEWSVVVVPDLSRKTANSTTSVCFEPSLGLALKLLNSQGELEKPALFKLIEQAKQQREFEESKRLLYVALTRAREQLLLTATDEKGGNLELLRGWMEEVLEPIPYDDNRAYPITPKMPELPVVSTTSLLQSSGPGLRELAVTALTDYARCPQQFYYRYVEAHPGYYEGTGKFAAEIGTLTHSALEHNIQTVDALVPFADDLSIEQVSEAFNLAQQFRTSTRFAALRETTTSYERTVTLELFHLILRGQIDLVGQDWVADFKTDQEMNPRAHRFQLWAYAKATGKSAAHIAYLRTNELYTFTADDLQAIEQEARTVIQGIQAGEFSPHPTVKTCSMCPYAEICDAAKSK
jgi:ATP-dependent helicase/nuclease subunit A